MQKFIANLLLSMTRRNNIEFKIRTERDTKNIGCEMFEYIRISTILYKWATISNNVNAPNKIIGQQSNKVYL
jgi:hypothetical protein